ncbi:MAG: hypothetical protein ONB30_05015 [candidate division KSB1 bacterium]|nr:hypothetical protein [candidate division KSB1 bacterium]
MSVARRSGRPERGETPGPPPKRFSRARTAFVLCGVAILVTTIACLNPFAPVLHQDPGDELIITEQKTPEEVLQNFRYAYTFKDSLLYANLLDSSFVFVFFDPNQGTSGLFMSWGRDVDLKATGRMFRSFDVIDLTWNSTIYAFEEENTAELSKSFSINFSGAFAEYRLSGSAIFSFRRCPHDGKWRITRWKDESEY